MYKNLGKTLIDKGSLFEDKNDRRRNSELVNKDGDDNIPTSTNIENHITMNGNEA